MSNTIIRVSDLGKRYILRHSGDAAKYQTFRETLTNSIKNLPAQLISSKNKPVSRDELWALKNVSFEIKQGDRVGIIGPNGSGKSTLLKMLSRIVEPTTGEIEISGSLASLLEVGTGFHPELTGRENIFLNGAILGMSRVEISRKFDEIVAFAEIERFLSTPVKRYSSGMYVKLAFSVAAHLEPDIMVVDEVLAVGDVGFQRKCIKKMEEVADDGRTVLFVSHNIGTVQTLCNRGILLNAGEITLEGDIHRCASAYLRGIENGSAESLVTRLDRGGNGACRFARIEVSQSVAGPSAALATGSPAFVIFELATSMSIEAFVYFTIYDEFGHAVTYFDSSEFGNKRSASENSDVSHFICDIEELSLLPGRYRIDAAIMHNGEVIDDVKGAKTFEVEPGVFAGRTVHSGGWQSGILIKHQWKTLSHSS